MILHIFLISVFSILMVKLSETYKLKKSFAVLLGAIMYLAFAVGIHFSLFIFGTEIYDNARLITFLNVASGIMGVGVAAIILVVKGSKK